MAIALTSDPIISEATVTTMLGMSGDEARFYINAASQAFLDFTRRQRITSGSVTDDEPLPPKAVPVLYLRAAPVTTVTSVKTYYEGDEDETLTTDDYTLNDDTGRMALHGHAIEGRDPNYRIKIVYTGGWTTVPASIQQAALELIRWYKAGAEGRAGVNSESREGFTTAYEVAALPTSVRDVWRRYMVI